MLIATLLAALCFGILQGQAALIEMYDNEECVNGRWTRPAEDILNGRAPGAFKVNTNAEEAKSLRLIWQYKDCPGADPDPIFDQRVSDWRSQYTAKDYYCRVRSAAEAPAGCKLLYVRLNKDGTGPIEQHGAIAPL